MNKGKQLVWSRRELMHSLALCSVGSTVMAPTATQAASGSGAWRRFAPGVWLHQTNHDDGLRNSGLLMSVDRATGIDLTRDALSAAPAAWREAPLQRLVWTHFDARNVQTRANAYTLMAHAQCRDHAALSGLCTSAELPTLTVNGKLLQRVGQLQVQLIGNLLTAREELLVYLPQHDLAFVGNALDASSSRADVQRVKRWLNDLQVRVAVPARGALIDATTA